MKQMELYDLIKRNCMWYSEYVITDRAIPYLADGLKNIHRRILWSMYIDGLTYNKNRTKSVNAAGSVLRFSPHGDASVYQACVRLANDSTNYPLIDGKGSFGSKTSKKIAPGASRYTEMRLSKIAQEYLKDINKNAVNMVDNYDNTRLEPELLPVTFPTVLCQPNTGIAVGIASNICPFPLEDVINNTIATIKGEKTKVMIPDFTTGGYVLNDEDALKQIHDSGTGNIKLRCKYHVEGNAIIIDEIPYTTTREAIIDKIIELAKEEKIKEITDINDDTGSEGLAITIYVKKNTNIESLMKRLYKMTPLEDSFSCNFTLIHKGFPVVLGVKDILKEWVEFRQETIRNIINFDITKKEKAYHLLKGLERILLDVDRTIDIIKKSNDEDVIERLKSNFNIDELQAENVANMKLRSINKENILKQLKDIINLDKEIQDLKYKINSEEEINNIIISELERVRDTYKQPRKTEIIENERISKDILIEDYNCRIHYTENYIKKHLKYSDNHKVKEGEVILGDIESNNKDVLIIITNKANRYRISVNDLDIVTPSSFGQYIHNIIDLEEGEKIIKIISIPSDGGYILSVFENGKIAKVDVKSFLSTNKKLVNCYNQESKLLDIAYIHQNTKIFLLSSNGKGLIVDTQDLNSKVSRSTQGVTGIKLKDGNICVGCKIGISKDDSFNLYTNNNREIYIHMDNVSSNENKNIFDYVSGRAANQGNHIFYSNSKNVKVDKIIFLK